jgi:PAS domain S-box-containing protein
MSDSEPDDAAVPGPPAIGAADANDSRDLALDQLFAHLPSTIWTTDEGLIVTFVRGHLLRQLGIEPNRAVGRSLPDLLLDGREDHPLIHGHLTALSGHETAVRIEWGGRLYVARIAPLRTRDGRITGCVGSHQEIAWLPDDEGTLRESDVRLRRVVDSNMIGIVFGDDLGRISDANDAFLQLVGHSREDLTDESLSWASLMPIETHQRQLQALDEILQTGRCAPFETEILRRDGERVPVLVGAARLSAKRREGVAFVLDISERKRSIRKLKAELACADALADAASLETAARQILQIMLTVLGWDSAACWIRGAAALELVAHEGVVPEAVGELESVVPRVFATQHQFWSPESGTLALPVIASGQCHGVLMLTGRQAGNGELLRTCRRIADRLAKFISR